MTCKELVELVTDYLEGRCSRGRPGALRGAPRAVRPLRRRTSSRSAQSVAVVGTLSEEHPAARRRRRAAGRVPRLEARTGLAPGVTPAPGRLRRHAQPAFSGLADRGGGGLRRALPARPVPGRAAARRRARDRRRASSSGRPCSGWVEVDETIAVVATIGLAFLLFLAGLEIEFDTAARAGCCGWPALGFALSFAHRASSSRSALKAAGLVETPLLVAIILSRDVARACSSRCSRTPARSSSTLRPARRSPPARSPTSARSSCSRSSSPARAAPARRCC